MDQRLFAVTGGSVAKRVAKYLEVTGSGPVHCHFSFPHLFPTMCSSQYCILEIAIEGKERLHSQCHGLGLKEQPCTSECSQ